MVRELGGPLFWDLRDFVYMFHEEPVFPGSVILGLHWGSSGIMENKMETTIMGYIGCSPSKPL